MPFRRFPPPWSIEDNGACFVVKDGGGQKLPIRVTDSPSATLGSLAPALTRLQIFSAIRRRAWRELAGAPFDQAYLHAVQKDVKSVLRCRGCGALFPTSELGPILLSPGAFAFYALISVVVAIFWFT